MLKKSLLSLAFGSFAIGMTEFTMMGILPDIAKDLQIDIPTAGHLIAIYALGVVVGAPVLVMASAKYPSKKVLIVLMLLFTLFNGLFAFAPEQNSLLLFRFLSGLPHGAFFGVGSVVAAKIAERGKEAQAISIMFTGMTIANLAGVPLGTFVGHHYSWRISYAVIALFGLATMIAVKIWLPNIQNDAKGSLTDQLQFFKTWKAWLLVAIISIGTGGLFSWLSYIAPLMTNIAHLEPAKVPLIMILVGLGMFFGNLIGGKLSDTIGANKATIVCFSLMATCLLIVYFTTHITFMAYLMSFVTGIVSFMAGSPLQMMLIGTAKGSETLAAAAGQASFNIGNTFGAYFGGLPLVYGFAYNSPLLVGMGMALSGVLLASTFLILNRKYS
ncbi:MFS transporter [Pseudopedobacter beijingensis]|uniref:MFS transporter n=1 Tax=Pseudopedobacter beijingensis TaxID=1207056 RepID=A0ABW4IC30_9SPHI